MLSTTRIEDYGMDNFFPPERKRILNHWIYVWQEWTGEFHSYSAEDFDPRGRNARSSQ